MAKKKTSKSSKKSPITQKELVIAAVVALMLGLLIGLLIGATTTNNEEVSDMSKTEIAQETSHAHSNTYEVEAENAPKVELAVFEDAKSGYNIKIIATDFRFTPEKVNGDNVLGEGHAHLYVDGEKVGRVYSEYYHYGGDFEGSKEFRVTLNANNHSDYTVNGDVIDATVVVTHNSEDPAHEESHDESAPHSH